MTIMVANFQMILIIMAMIIIMILIMIIIEILMVIIMVVRIIITKKARRLRKGARDIERERGEKIRFNSKV